MTFLPGRMIALLLMMAVALAGTPNQIAANDGLNSSRFSVRSIDTRSDGVTILVPSAGTDNPLRKDRVEARISGDVKVASRDMAPANFAAIVEGYDSIDIIANHRGRHIANQTGWFDLQWQSWNQLIADGFGSSTRHLGKGLEWLDDQIPVTRQSIGATSASHRSKEGKSRASIRQIKTDSNSTPRRGPAAQNLRKMPAGNMSLFVVEPGFELTSRSMIEREIFDDVICMIGCEDDSRKTPARNGKLFGFGEDLLIDEFLPRAAQGSSTSNTRRPARLAIPAMMIGHRTTSEVMLSGQSLIQTAKAVVRTLLGVIEPLAWLESAVELHQRIESAVIELDELIWSAELNHIWNTCGMYE